MVLEGALTVFGVGCAGGIVAEILHWWNLREAEQLSARAHADLIVAEGSAQAVKLRRLTSNRGLAGNLALASS
jgi:hypothetical protein